MKLFSACTLLLGALLSAGCAKTVTCVPEPVVLTFMGYAEQEVSTIHVRWYEKGSSLATVKDSAVCQLADKWARTDDRFTCYWPAKDSGKDMNSTADLEIYIPSVQRTYRISNMRTEGATEKRIIDDTQAGDEQCFDRVTEYDLDGAHVSRTNPSKGYAADYGMEVELKK